MTTARCPACHAAVPAEAPWCNLCFADLRTPVAEPVTVGDGPAALAGAASAASAAGSGRGRHAAPRQRTLPTWRRGDAAVTEVALTEAAVAEVTVAEAPEVAAAPAGAPPAYEPEDLPVQRASDVRVVAEPTWPCSVCGESMPLAADHCLTCGSPFMGGTTAKISLVLPYIGDLADLSSGQKWAFAGIGAVVVSVAFWLLFLLLGSVL